MQFARCLLGAIFLHRLDKNANRHLRRPCFLVSFLLEFWPDLEVSVRYRFPAQAHGMLSGRQSKIYLNIGSNSYDFCVSVCLELSVWSCLSVEVSGRDHFPAQARGILNRHLRQGRVRSLRRCLLETILLHRLGEY